MFECRYFSIGWPGVMKLQATYGKVDVMQELEMMAQWLDDNPRRQKKNYRRFVSNWLKAEQRKAVEAKKQANVGTGPQAVGRIKPEVLARIQARR